MFYPAHKISKNKFETKICIKGKAILTKQFLASFISLEIPMHYFGALRYVIIVSLDHKTLKIVFIHDGQFFKDTLYYIRKLYCVTEHEVQNMCGNIHSIILFVMQLIGRKFSKV